MTTQQPNIAIIGAGIIGLSCAWELAKRGAHVTIYDRGQPGFGASFAAAGMLAVGYEAAVESRAHPGLFALCQSSAELWPAFAEALQTESGYGVQYRPGETLAVAPPDSSANALMASYERLQTHGIACDRLSASQLQALEPSLSPDITAAIRLPTDGQVNNRAVVRSLLAACHKRGVRIVNHTPAEKVDPSRFDRVLWSVGADERMEAFGISPVKGAAFSLKPGSYLPSRIIRFGGHYIVPKKDRVIIGATSEPGVRDWRPDDVLLGQLRQRASGICPGVEGGALISSWSGLRPATADHAPLLGLISADEFIAAGHYRNGILLAPITAQIIADMMLEGKVSELAGAFAPDRFASAAP